MNDCFFQNSTGDPDYSVSGFWFWNDQIADDKITEQLQMMKRVGANQPVIHSRSGRINEYLSDDWFQRIRHTVSEAKRNNQKLWLYDEDNWPSGNCSWRLTQDERLREHYLHFDTVQLPGGERFTADITGTDYVCITAYTPSAAPVSLLGMVKNNQIDWLAESNTEIVLVSVRVDDYDGVGKFSIDYLSKEAFRAFIRSTHEQYKDHLGNAFGSVIAGMFMDETRFCNALPWTAELPKEFIRRKGYDLCPLLPLLRKDKLSGNNLSPDELFPLVRYDYYDVISDLYAEATCKLIYELTLICTTAKVYRELQFHGIKETINVYFTLQTTICKQKLLIYRCFQPIRLLFTIQKMERLFHLPRIRWKTTGSGVPCTFPPIVRFCWFAEDKCRSIPHTCRSTRREPHFVAVPAS